MFDFLVYLIQHRRRVVTQRELVEHVWSGCSVVPSAIRHCVWAARCVVGDIEAIRTVRPSCYQWLPAVRVLPWEIPSPEFEYGRLGEG